MTFVGCELHTRKQQVALLDTRTGEVSEHQLAHDGTAVEEFYATLPRPVGGPQSFFSMTSWSMCLSRDQIGRLRRRFSSSSCLTGAPISRAPAHISDSRTCRVGHGCHVGAGRQPPAPGLAAER